MLLLYTAAHGRALPDRIIRISCVKTLSDFSILALRHVFSVLLFLSSSSCAYTSPFTSSIKSTEFNAQSEHLRPTYVLLAAVYHNYTLITMATAWYKFDLGSSIQFYDTYFVIPFSVMCLSHTHRVEFATGLQLETDSGASRLQECTV